MHVGGVLVILFGRVKKPHHFDGFGDDRFGILNDGRVTSRFHFERLVTSPEMPFVFTGRLFFVGSEIAYTSRRYYFVEYLTTRLLPCRLRRVLNPDVSRYAESDYVIPE